MVNTRKKYVYKKITIFENIFLFITIIRLRVIVYI